MEKADPNRISRFISSLIWRLMEEFIPSRLIENRTLSHPWMNERVLTAIQRKHCSEGLSGHPTAVKECSQIILEEYFSYVASTKKKLQSLKSSSTKFWKISKRLLRKSDRVSLIPSLQRHDNSWARSAQEKADELADSLNSK